MAETLEPLILDLVEWVDREPRTYRDVMEAWRTSCPRLTVWEDALEHGMLAHRREGGRHDIIVTSLGRAGLAAMRGIPA